MAIFIADQPMGPGNHVLRIGQNIVVVVGSADAASLLGKYVEARLLWKLIAKCDYFETQVGYSIVRGFLYHFQQRDCRTHRPVALASA